MSRSEPCPTCGAIVLLEVTERREEVKDDRGRVIGFREVGEPLEVLRCPEGHDFINGINVATSRGFALLEALHAWQTIREGDT